MQPAEVDDCALADLPGKQEIHTFDGGKLGSFTKSNGWKWCILVWQTLIISMKNLQFLKTYFCIYRFKHENRETKAVMTQINIAVGKITKCKICEQTGKVFLIHNSTQQKVQKLQML